MIGIMRRSQPRTKEPTARGPRILIPETLMAAVRADAVRSGISLNAWFRRLAARETGLTEYDFPDPPKDP
ncbi:hypothetical protein D8M21_11030 [Kocuria sp. HSID16901]|nr:hypothetical protein D8M21_11030 [Kocuria sp. HSID16901]